MSNFSFPSTLNRWDPAQPVKQFMPSVNWDNRPPLMSTVLTDLGSLPTALIMRDWTVEQFFAAFSWTGPRVRVQPLPPVEEPVTPESVFTLADFAELF